MISRKSLDESKQINLEFGLIFSPIYAWGLALSHIMGVRVCKARARTCNRISKIFQTATTRESED